MRPVEQKRSSLAEAPTVNARRDNPGGHHFCCVIGWILAPDAAETNRGVQCWDSNATLARAPLEKGTRHFEFNFKVQEKKYKQSTVVSIYY